jgi:hypothetical protein
MVWGKIRIFESGTHFRSSLKQKSKTTLITDFLIADL